MTACGCYLAPSRGASLAHWRDDECVAPWHQAPRVQSLTRDPALAIRYRNTRSAIDARVRLDGALWSPTGGCAVCSKQMFVKVKVLA